MRGLFLRLLLTPTERELLTILRALPDDLRPATEAVIRESGRLSALGADSSSQTN